MSGTREMFGAEVLDIPVESIAHFDDICRANLHLRDNMSKRMAESYARTREKAVQTVRCEGMYKPLAIEAIDEASVTFQPHARLECPIVASALQGAEFAVVLAVSAKGLEPLADDGGNSMLDSMMYSGWGVGFSTGGQQWVEEVIRNKAHEFGLFSGKSWSPGLENVDMDLQRDLFHLIGCEQIGIELLPSGALRPSMSVLGVIAVGSDPSLELQETAWMI